MSQDPIGADLILTQPSVAEAAQFVREAWEHSIEAIIRTGRRLIAVREIFADAPGKWSELLGRGGHEGALPFKQAHAYRLIAIAENADRLAPHVGQLPIDIYALNELTRLDEPTFRARLADGTIRPDMQRRDLATLVKQDRRGAREIGLAAGVRALPDKRFGVIYADPPWAFETRSEAGKDRAPDNHYPTMDLEAIKALPVGGLAAEDCALFLWVTMPCLEQAFEVIGAWGFAYKTCAFVWVKTDQAGKPVTGLGYWTRANAELVLLATRGSPKRVNANISQIVQMPRGAHSAKPEEVAARIEFLVDGPYLELFRRGAPRKGWDAWGNEASLPPEAGRSAEGAEPGARDEEVAPASPASRREQTVEAAEYQSSEESQGALAGALLGTPEGSVSDQIPSTDSETPAAPAAGEPGTGGASAIRSAPSVSVSFPPAGLGSEEVASASRRSAAGAAFEQQLGRAEAALDGAKDAIANSRPPEAGRSGEAAEPGAREKQFGIPLPSFLKRHG